MKWREALAAPPRPCQRSPACGRHCSLLGGHEPPAELCLSFCWSNGARKVAAVGIQEGPGLVAGWGEHCHTPEIVKITLKEHAADLQTFYLRFLWSAGAPTGDEDNLVQKGKTERIRSLMRNRGERNLHQAGSFEEMKLLSARQTSVS